MLHRRRRLRISSAPIECAPRGASSAAGFRATEWVRRGQWRAGADGSACSIGTGVTVRWPRAAAPHRHTPPRGRERLDFRERRWLRRAAGHGRDSADRSACSIGAGAAAPHRRARHAGARGAAAFARRSGCAAAMGKVALTGAHAPSAAVPRLRPISVRRPRARAAWRGVRERWLRRDAATGEVARTARVLDRRRQRSDRFVVRRPFRADALRPISARRPAGASGAAGFARDAVAQARRGHWRALARWHGRTAYSIGGGASGSPGCAARADATSTTHAHQPFSARAQPAPHRRPPPRGHGRLGGICARRLLALLTLPAT
jgi:hypothetical protein